MSAATTRALPYAGLALLALVVRIVYLLEWHDTPLFSVPIGDARQYDLWARGIAGGAWFGSEVFYQAPLYPYFMALVYAVAGPDFWALRLVQIVLGSTSCVLLALAGRRFFDARIGLVAGGLLALYAPAIYFDGLVQKGVFGGFFTSLLLFELGEFIARHDTSRTKRGAWPWLLAAGLTLGAFALARENALILTPIVAVWLFVHFHGEPVMRRAQWVAVLVVGVILVLGPVGLRNRAIGGRFMLTTSQLGPNFYIGNNPEANGRYVPLRKGRGSARYERGDATELAQQALGRQLTPAEVSSYWLDRSLRYVREQPADWLGLMLRKGWLVWHAQEVIDTDSIEAYQDASGVLRTLGRVFHFGVLAPLALVGAWVTRREWRRLSLLYVVLLSMAGAVAVFYVLARYRFPIVPILALFAAAGSLELWRLTRQAEWRRIARIGLLISIPAIGCNWPLRGSVDPRTITYYSLGSGLIEQGRFAEGREQLDKALALDPDFGDARYKLGDSLLKQGNPSEALRHFERTLRHDPRHADAHTGLGMALLLQGDPARATSHFETAIELKPDDAAAHNNLASALARQGRIVEATLHLEHAVRADPDDPDLRTNLGKVLLAQGDLVGAVAQFEYAVGLAPDHAEAQQGLDLALRRLQEEQE